MDYLLEKQQAIEIEFFRRWQNINSFAFLQVNFGRLSTTFLEQVQIYKLHVTLMTHHHDMNVLVSKKGQGSRLMA